MRRFVPSLSSLQAFEFAARYMNFTKAAEDRSITQSGVSRQITNLETQLGVKLFERDRQVVGVHGSESPERDPSGRPRSFGVCP